MCCHNLMVFILLPFYRIFFTSSPGEPSHILNSLAQMPLSLLNVILDIICATLTKNYLRFPTGYALSMLSLHCHIYLHYSLTVSLTRDWNLALFVFIYSVLNRLPSIWFHNMQIKSTHPFSYRT